MTRRSAVFGLRAMLCAGVLALPVCASAANKLAGNTQGTIRWDTYGVPHIYGPDVQTVARGLGYAQIENHAETLLNNIAHARGRYAEYFGPGDGNANIISDTQVRQYGIPARAAQWVAEGGSEQAGILNAFCAGINEYAQVHGDTIDPVLKTILPIVPADITAGEQETIWFTFLPEQDNDPALLSAWQTGGIAAANALARSFTPTGSNGWAIAPSKSADGNAILMGNPHLPWGVNQPAPGLGIYQWIEANLVVGDPNAPTLNASGVTFVGGPFIGIGFNDYLGWTHTNNTIKNADLYQLTLDSTGKKYLFGGNMLPLSHTQQTLLVKQPDGSEQKQVIDIYGSVHGPVVSFSGDGKTALVLRVPGLNQPSLVTQYWHMIEATTLNDFITANSMLQMPFFNVIYADRAGHILYLFGGQQPVRRGGVWGDYAGILDGTDPSKLWTRTLKWTQLPQAIDPPGGFVANSNNPPWTSAFPAPASLQHSNYATYIAPDFMDFRPQHGTTFLQSQQKFSTTDILTGKMSTQMLLADRVLPDLLLAVQASGNATAIAAAKVLAAWDHTADANSVGGPLFEAWWNLVVADVAAGKLPADNTDNFYSQHPAFRIPWNKNNPLTTPVGLANASTLVPYLATAANNLNTTFASTGGMSVTWGNAHRTFLVYRDGQQQAITGIAANNPQSGADDDFGPIRVTNPFFLDALGEFLTYGGDGYVQIIEFTPTGATGGTLLTYGNASRPNSPHIADQLPYFDTKTLKPALRTLSAVTAATVTTETY